MTRESRRRSCSGSRHRRRRDPLLRWMLLFLWFGGSSTPSRSLMRAAVVRCCGVQAWGARPTLRHFSTLKSSKQLPLPTVTNGVVHTRHSCEGTPIGQPTRASFSSSASSTSLFATAVDDDDMGATTAATAAGDDPVERSLDGDWDVGGLKRETQRLLQRCHKKVGKAHERLRAAEVRAHELSRNASATLEELENCPNLEAFRIELSQVQERLRGLNNLENALQPLKNKPAVLPPTVAQLALDLGVSDQPFVPPPRGPPKPKGKPPAPRLPYRRYYAKNGVEIRVGKRAADNDQLTLNPLHRDGADWWMHAAGCPGSHVVIRCHDNVLDHEAKLDAAALAARHSKCATPIIKVSLTRARDIRKPPGAKDGLVQLVGMVQTVVVDMKAAQERLKRLDATELVN